MSLKIPNTGLCDAGSEETSRIAMSDIFMRRGGLSGSYLCSNVTEQRTTGLTQDQHTNSGIRLPFVLLPSFYRHKIIWRKNHKAGQAVRRGHLAQWLYTRTSNGDATHVQSLVPALLTATQTDRELPSSATSHHAVSQLSTFRKTRCLHNHL